MRIIIFGATGMVGQGALRESLLAADVEEVLAIGRRPTGVRHPKLTEATLADLADLSPLTGRLAGFDACFYCLGVSSTGMSEADYTKISYDLPTAAAHALSTINPEMTFVYVSGAGTDIDGRAAWARIKGRTELEIIKTFPHGYAFRPGFIQPTHGATSKTRLYRWGYAVTAPITPFLIRHLPRWTTTNDALGRAMLRAARIGFPTRIVENIDLR
ncbi:NAD-dependent epimerase/dehydratase family protein [Symbioplanes lichenis]|uniref:NAD-dependent epimerase/dehydratase family protein n=1 Tax=Symbioplanes lichenis TaxID=1629072 RepID=UPI00273912CD|nr:NAD-dependent epimerase/dehydratase family protein [Actinoplanes lichenis]